MEKYPDDNQWIKEIIDTANSQEELLEKEIKYIQQFDTINNGYNSHPGGYCGWAGQTLSEEHKDNISKGHDNFWNSEEGQDRKILLSNKFMGKNNPQYGKQSWKGKHHSDETKQKISKANKGNTGGWNKGIPMPEIQKMKIKESKLLNPWKPSQEQIEKRSAKLIGSTRNQNTKDKMANAQSINWLVTFPDGTTKVIFNLNKFCREHKLDQGNMMKVVNGITKQSKGFKVSRI